jgi:hypothetical protein
MPLRNINSRYLLLFTRGEFLMAKIIGQMRYECKNASRNGARSYYQIFNYYEYVIKIRG